MSFTQGATEKSRTPETGYSRFPITRGALRGSAAGIAETFAGYACSLSARMDLGFSTTRRTSLCTGSVASQPQSQTIGLHLYRDVRSLCRCVALLRCATFRPASQWDKRLEKFCSKYKKEFNLYADCLTNANYVKRTIGTQCRGKSFYGKRSPGFYIPTKTGLHGGEPSRLLPFASCFAFA